MDFAKFQKFNSQPRHSNVFLGLLKSRFRYAKINVIDKNCKYENRLLGHSLAWPAGAGQKNVPLVT